MACKLAKIILKNRHVIELLGILEPLGHKFYIDDGDGKEEIKELK